MRLQGFDRKYWSSLSVAEAPNLLAFDHNRQQSDDENANDGFFS